MTLNQLNSLIDGMEEIENTRPIWDEYFMKLSWLVAERSTCLRHHVGAIIVKDRKILSTGYNGAVAKTIDCLTLGCLRNQLNIPSGQRHELCRAVHAEQNAIIQAAANGVSILNSTLYCTHSPCILCAKMIANAGIKKVVISEVYPDGAYKELFNESGIETHTIQVNNLLISQKK